MRCKKCGFPNRPDETVCANCHSPLVSNGIMDENRPSYSHSNIAATIPEGAAFPEMEEERLCPKCGYPLRDNSSRCPNCNYVSSPQKFYRQEMMDNPAKDKNPITGTINPFKMEVEAEPSFILRPIIRQNEKKEVSDLKYEGKEVLLNRNNTEADNPSITSHTQAILYYSDGNWYVEDKSEQCTTFVCAKNKIELHDGDILLLGNRLFEFHLSSED